MLNTTKEEIEIFGERTETDEQIQERINKWQKRVAAVGRCDDIVKEFEGLSDDELWLAWIERNSLKVAARAH